MTSPDLFEAAADDRSGGPLAARMRPRSLEELVGQQHLLAPGSPLRRLVEGDERAVSLILFGPPGTGKTTIAHLVSRATGRQFAELSAVTAGVKDVRMYFGSWNEWSRDPSLPIEEGLPTEAKLTKAA